MLYRSGDVPREIGSRLWSSVIAPRPIFLIVSVSADGLSNIAPYSSVAVVSIYPPIVTISFGKRNGLAKNTLTNILANKFFTLNVVPNNLALIANDSAEGTDFAEDFERLKLTRCAIGDSPVSGILESPVSIACEYIKTIDVEEMTSTLMLARCNAVDLKDEYMDCDIFDPVQANLVASIGLEDYVTLKGEAFSLPRTWD
jgi:flavin reductase (DIM6/NTAB) family NADH-FMN oxidoreductase RutF